MRGLAIKSNNYIQLYKKDESQTDTGKLKKEWKEGQLYINGKAVTIKRSWNSLQAIMDNSLVMKVDWD